MKQNYLVELTQEDIKKGVRKDPNYCALGWALRRRFPKQSVFINEEEIVISSCEMVSNGKTSRQLQVFMRKFDKGIKVEPFTFKIKLNHICKTEHWDKFSATQPVKPL